MSVISALEFSRRFYKFLIKTSASAAVFGIIDSNANLI